MLPCSNFLASVVCCRLPPAEDRRVFVIFKHLFIFLKCLVARWKDTAVGRMSGSHSVVQRDGVALAKYDLGGVISVFL